MSNGYEDDLEAEEALIGRDFEAEERGEVDNLELAKVDARTAGNRGRPTKVDPVKMVAWRQGRKATVAETARHWKVSEPTVKRLSREYGDAAEQERIRYRHERLDKELDAHVDGYFRMYHSQRQKHLMWTELKWFARMEAAKGTPQETEIEAAMLADIDAADSEFRADWERGMGPIPD